MSTDTDLAEGMQHITDRRWDFSSGFLPSTSDEPGPDAMDSSGVNIRAMLDDIDAAIAVGKATEAMLDDPQRTTEPKP